MITAAKFLTFAELNGRSVAFFSPPHDEPDFVWIYLEGLARAYLPSPEATRVLKAAQQLGQKFRPVTTATFGDRIFTIGCHQAAQAVAMLIDKINGHRQARGEPVNGPAFSDYCFTSAEVDYDHRRLGIDGVRSAADNMGGPFARAVDKTGGVS